MISGFLINSTSSDGINITSIYNYFVIKNCKIIGNKTHSFNGIVLSQVKNGLIDNNIISFNENGIFCNDSTSLIVMQNNIITNNNNSGIKFEHAGDYHKHDTIRYNQISNNTRGISTITFRYNDIYYNDITNNSVGLSFSMCLCGAGQNNITYNNISHNQIGIAISSIREVISKNSFYNNSDYSIYIVPSSYGHMIFFK